MTVVDISNQLVLTTRWPLLFAVVAIIAAGRFRLFASRSRRGSARRAAATGASRAVDIAPNCAALSRNWFIPSAIGFVIAYPLIIYFAVGIGGATEMDR